MSRGCQLRRQETSFLPECLDDYVGPDNSVRALDLYIDKLDLGQLGFHVKAENTVGSPVDFPANVMLKILIYGYLNQVRSSRKLERETKRNVEVIWLTEKAQPNYWTINEFRKQNRAAFKNVLKDFHQVCAALELFSRELIAIDGSFFKALNNKSNNFTKARLDKLEARIDKAIEDYDQALDESEDELLPETTPGSEETLVQPETSVEGGKENDDNNPGNATEKPPCCGQEDDNPAKPPSEPVKNFRAVGTLSELKAKKERIGELRDQAEASASGQVSLIDPDSRLLKKGNQSLVGHNVQLAADGQANLLVSIEIVQAGNDSNQLEPVAKSACEALDITPTPEKPVALIADAGFFNCAQISRLENANIQVHVPAIPTTAIKAPGYRVDDFEYDPATDEYICPQGQRLYRHTDTIRKEITYRTYYNFAACRDCPCRAECTKGKYRKIQISEYREVEKTVAERIESQPEIYAKRKGLIEHPFGTIKSIWGYAQFMVKGKEGCNGELNLMGFCYNWKRVLNLVSLETLMAAILA